jgi:heme oxygenase
MKDSTGAAEDGSTQRGRNPAPARYRPAATSRPRAAAETARDRLRRATAETHSRLHALRAFSRLISGSLTLSEYSWLLARLYGVHAPLEARLRGVPAPWCYDMDPLSHANARLLDADLFALNGATSQIADLSTCVRLPVIGSPGAFVGCVYVIEGAGRGGRVMAQRLGALLGAGVTEGRRFFLGCPVADTSPWLRCCIAVERGAADGHIDAMIAVAVDTFGALENWLQERTEIA